MAPLVYQARFTQDEYAIIRRGLVPEEMEDKWFVFWEASSLFFHRSWTGHCVYQVELRPSEDGCEVAQAAVSTDPEHYRRSSDQYEAALLDFLIRGLLLHQSVEFPMPPDISVSAPRGLYQHHIAGTGFPERTLNGHKATFSRLKRWFGL
jgi:hypothetical protein